MEKTEAEARFDYEGVLRKLDAMNADQTRVDIQDFHDLCKAFTKLSSSLGYLISWGFQGTLPCLIPHT